MIRSIQSWEPYASFLQAYPQETDSLAKAFARKGALAFGAFEGEEMTGLFLFSPLEEGYLVDICIIYAMISFLAVVVLSKVYTGVYLEQREKKNKNKSE